MTKYTVVVCGEANSGKTALLSALNGEQFNAEAQNQRYWNRQMEGKKIEKVIEDNYEEFNLEFVEVMGSRGRMSNHYALKSVLARADIALYCFPLDSDIGWKTRGLSTIQRYAEKVPIICVGTKEDLMPKDLDLKCLKGKTFIQTSVKLGRINDVIPTILSGLRNKLEEEEQVHPMVAVEIPKEQKTEPIKKEETKPNTQEKRTSKRLIQKLNKIFSLEQVQAKDDPMDIVPVA